MATNTIPLFNQESIAPRLCGCGCGCVTNIASRAFADLGIKKGDYYRFRHGHQPHPPYKASDEAREKISKALRGRKHSAESIEKMRTAAKGKPKSAEHCRKIGLTKIGNQYRLGKPQTDESKQKNRDSHLGKITSEETKRKMSATKKGKVYRPAGWKHTKESVEKMKAAYTGWNNGEGNFFWKGGVTPIAVLIRSCSNYHQWRHDVFAKDWFTCVFCGNKKDIVADHYPENFLSIMLRGNIETVEDAVRFPDFWNVANGRTLCATCHRKRHADEHRVEAAKRREMKAIAA